MIIRTLIPCVIAAFLGAAIMAVAYEPASIAIYKICESRYAYPIKARGGKIAIRNDSYGEGDYGAKRSGGRKHTGIDIEAPVGTAVYASKSGVAMRGNVPTGYGRYVMIQHPDGMQTMYGHLTNWAVYTGQKVRKGDIIGFVGKTGNAANKLIQPHLHFEIREYGEPVDPLPLMK